MTTREQRGQQLAESGTITRHGNSWRVPSQSGSGLYLVTQTAGGLVCSCPDFDRRCKHVICCEMLQGRQDEAKEAAANDGSVSVLPSLRSADVQGELPATQVDGANLPHVRKEHQRSGAEDEPLAPWEIDDQKYDPVTGLPISDQSGETQTASGVRGIAQPAGTAPETPSGLDRARRSDPVLKPKRDESAKGMTPHQTSGCVGDNSAGVSAAAPLSTLSATSGASRLSREGVAADGKRPRFVPWPCEQCGKPQKWIDCPHTLCSTGWIPVLSPDGERELGREECPTCRDLDGSQNLVFGDWFSRRQGGRLACFQCTELREHERRLVA